MATVNPAIVAMQRKLSLNFAKRLAEAQRPNITGAKVVKRTITFK